MTAVAMLGPSKNHSCYWCRNGWYQSIFETTLLLHLLHMMRSSDGRWACDWKNGQRCWRRVLAVLYLCPHHCFKTWGSCARLDVTSDSGPSADTWHTDKLSSWHQGLSLAKQIFSLRSEAVLTFPRLTKLINVASVVPPGFQTQPRSSVFLLNITSSQVLI